MKFLPKLSLTRIARLCIHSDRFALRICIMLLRTATVPSTDEAVESPESADTDDQAQSHQRDETDTPAGMWQRLRRWIAGVT